MSREHLKWEKKSMVEDLYQPVAEYGVCPPRYEETTRPPVNDVL